MDEADVFHQSHVSERLVVNGRVSDAAVEFYAHIAREQQRKRYREERRHPEWIDLGGES